MLKILTPPDRGASLCDGISRRNFLKVGGLGAAGLSLPQLLALEKKAGIGSSHKSVILIYLVGGPPHQDMFDLKPNAPREVSGPMKPIGTNVPGIEICELFPRMAKMMDKFTIIRSLVGAQANHDASQCYTGRAEIAPPGGWPQFGSVVNKLQGNVDPSVPGFVSMCYECTHGPYNEPGPGMLGVVNSAVRPVGGLGQADLTLQGITTDRLADRVSLLKSFDGFRRDADASGMMAGLDTFTQQAMNMLTSSKLAEALDLSKEDPRTIERYGGIGDTVKRIDENGAPRVPQSFLAARRLIEAGARVVTVNYSKWDWHGGKGNEIFKREEEDFPLFDQAITALVEDLHQRGLDKDCSVLVWGEFGRTPTISAQVGRDHWPRVAMALLAGGGMKMGQVIGSTDRLGGEADSRPVTFPEVFATLYHNLGIDVANTTIKDRTGRTHYLVEAGTKPIRELV